MLACWRGLACFVTPVAARGAARPGPATPDGAESHLHRIPAVVVVAAAPLHRLRERALVMQHAQHAGQAAPDHALACTHMHTHTAALPCTLACMHLPITRMAGGGHNLGARRITLQKPP